ncbi:MAG TPA: hypothetical protein VFU81_13805, partial [Thermomicrobiales bacterium]|nr:hypothetical protein [Thermomicrobiales bacterium]
MTHHRDPPPHRLLASVNEERERVVTELVSFGDDRAERDAVNPEFGIGRAHAARAAEDRLGNHPTGLNPP